MSQEAAALTNTIVNDLKQKKSVLDNLRKRLLEDTKISLQSFGVLQDMVKKLVTRFNENKKEISDGQTKLNVLTAEKQSLEEDKKADEEKIKLCKAERKIYKDHYDNKLTPDAQDRIKDLEEKIEQCKTNVEEYKNEIRDKERGLFRYVNEVKELTKQRVEIERNLATEKAALEEEKRKLEKCEADKKQLIEQQKKLQKELEECKQSIPKEWWKQLVQALAHIFDEKLKVDEEIAKLNKQVIVQHKASREQIGGLLNNYDFYEGAFVPNAIESQEKFWKEIYKDLGTLIGDGETVQNKLVSQLESAHSAIGSTFRLPPGIEDIFKEEVKLEEDPHGVLIKAKIIPKLEGYKIELPKFSIDDRAKEILKEIQQKRKEFPMASGLPPKFDSTFGTKIEEERKKKEEEERKKKEEEDKKKKEEEDKKKEEEEERKKKEEEERKKKEEEERKKKEEEEYGYKPMEIDESFGGGLMYDDTDYDIFASDEEKELMAGQLKYNRELNGWGGTSLDPNYVGILLD